MTLFKRLFSKKKPLGENQLIDSIKKLTDDLVKQYESSYVRILVDLLPGIDNTFMHFRAQRLRVYFEELASGTIDLTDDEIQGEDFLHAFFATVRAASRTRQRKKIRLFARLFMNYIRTGKFDEDNTDVFDEVLAILEDLSLREFQMLMILDRFEKTCPLNGDEHPADRVSEYWEEFLGSVESELKIQLNHIPGMLTRLGRTGLYGPLPGTYYGKHGNKGYLTPTFSTFIDALNSDSDDGDNVAGNGSESDAGAAPGKWVGM